VIAFFAAGFALAFVAFLATGRGLPARAALPVRLIGASDLALAFLFTAGFALAFVAFFAMRQGLEVAPYEERLFNLLLAYHHLPSGTGRSGGGQGLAEAAGNGNTLDSLPAICTSRRVRRTECKAP
jgi:hypothetical protein